MAAALPIIALVGTVAGAGLQAFGAIQQGNAQAQSAKYQAAIAEQNQQQAQRNAAAERQAGDQAAMNNDLKNKQVQGEMLAEQGASGLAADSGSPLSLQSSAAILGRADTETIKYNSNKKAYNFEVEASNFGNQAKLETMSAENSQLAGYLSAGGSLLSGATAVSSKWNDFRSKGLLT